MNQEKLSFPIRLSEVLHDLTYSCDHEGAFIILKDTWNKVSYYEDYFLKVASFDKQALLGQAIIKTLKLAAVALAGLLLKAPLKVAVAYNAISKLIKLIEQGKIKLK